MPFQTTLDLINSTRTINESDVVNKEAMVDVDDLFILRIVREYAVIILLI